MKHKLRDSRLGSVSSYAPTHYILIVQQLLLYPSLQANIVLYSKSHPESPSGSPILIPARLVLMGLSSDITSVLAAASLLLVLLVKFVMLATVKFHLLVLLLAALVDKFVLLMLVLLLSAVVQLHAQLTKFVIEDNAEIEPVLKLPAAILLILVKMDFAIGNLILSAASNNLRLSEITAP